MINQTWAAGRTAAFAVISWRPGVNTTNYTQAFPPWYQTSHSALQCTGHNNPPGCDHYICDASSIPGGVSGTDLFAWNHDYQGFIDAQVALINAIRAKYDNPTWTEKIAYIDGRLGIGSWSENHTYNQAQYKNAGGQIVDWWPMPAWASAKPINDAWLAFEHIPVVVIYDWDRDSGQPGPGDDHPWNYVATQKELGSAAAPVGWRTDGLDSTWIEIQQIMGWSSACANAWRYGPMTGELTESAVSLTDNRGFTLQEVIARLTSFHACGWNTKHNNNGYPNDSQIAQIIDDWYRDHAGYRLYIQEATIPNVAAANVPFAVSVEMRNSHIAALYRAFYNLQIKFVRQGGGASDVILTLTGAEIREIVKDEPQVFSASGALVTAGTYDVYVGIIQDPAFGTGAPVQLGHDPAINSQDGSNQWWTHLGTATAA